MSGHSIVGQDWKLTERGQVESVMDLFPPALTQADISIIVERMRMELRAKPKTKVVYG